MLVYISIKENVMKKKITEIKYYDFKESLLLDIGAPVFVAKDHYGIVDSLESFKYAFSHATREFLQTFNISVFKQLFVQASKKYNYPKDEAKAVLDDCIDKMTIARNSTVSVG